MNGLSGFLCVTGHGRLAGVRRRIGGITTELEGMMSGMSILDTLALLDPRVAREVHMMDRGLSERFKRQPRGGFLEEQGLPGEAVNAILSDRTPPSGIFGVGATVTENHISPAVFVLPGLAGPSMVPTPIWNTYAAPLVARYARNMPKDLYAISIPMPAELNGTVNVGSELVCQQYRGTCGVEITTRSGERAVLTAGHVAKNVGSSVTAAGKKFGTVALTDYLALHPPTDIVADVAVLRLEPRVTVASTRLITGPGTGKQFDNVIADVQQGIRGGWVRSVVPSFALYTGVGCWGEILITDRAISEPGDSGAPVYLDDDSGTVIGHVVAGVADVYTLIQDINFILARGQATMI